MNFKYIATEKAMKFIEQENKLLVAVDRRYDKKEIKEEFEKLFDVKISSLKTFIRGNQKYAYLKLKDSKAIDLATKLGVM